MLIADLHIHSKYSRATSADCVPEQLEWWARRKGIGLVGTGDFTHPAWRAELMDKLVPAGDGLYRLRADLRQPGAPDVQPRFVLSAEISSIYKQDGRTRKVHNVILMPGLEQAEAFSRRLEALGCNLHSDGRPILGLSSRDLLEIALDVCPETVFIPAHIWTPHFSLFGAFSGFDTVEACFGDLTGYVHAVETGLSSDPPMNWRLSQLDRFTLVSHSDAHSPAKLGREANVLDIEPSYAALRRALEGGTAGGFAGTLEFFPEEGKYHFDGHRACNQCLSPAEAERAQGVCPVCGKRLTLGVAHRAAQLADRPEGYRPDGAPPFERLVPLQEVVASSIGASVAGRKTAQRLQSLTDALGDEFFILRQAPLEDIERAAGPCVAEGIRRVRCGEVEAMPGYDGVFGRIQVLRPDEVESIAGQLSFLGATPAPERRQHDAAPVAKPVPDAAPAAAPRADALNARQQEAVCAPERAIAVIAGPGTGKTKTLVERIAHLVQARRVPPARITAVTFTNQAAGEMRERLEQRLGRRAARAMTIGTFHAICLRLPGVTQAGRESLADGAQALSCAAEVVQALALKTSPKRLLAEISRHKSGLESDVPQEAVAAYDARLSARGLIDFDGLLMRALELDASAPRAPFTHLLVDEFQDINPVQRLLVDAWSRESQSVFVIGDPDQSIYGFRGADARCFERFLEARPDARVVRLTDNYRSAPQVLRCALPVVGHAQDLLTPHRPDGPRVRLVEAPDEFSQALFITKEIGRMVGGVDMLAAQEQARAGAERGFSDFAVLYRTHRQADALELCLRKEGIPYVVTGRDATLEDEQVLACLHGLRLALHPESAQPADESALAFAASLGARAGRERPRKLIEAWMLAQGIAASPALERLLGIADLHASLASLLDAVALGGEADVSRCAGRVYTPEAVRLMTLHGAKGLEFPVVFVPGLSDGLLPLRQQGLQADEQEERRLLYVGMTRAREELILASCGAPSPFVRDLPGDCLRRERARGASRPAEGRQLSFL